MEEQKRIQDILENLSRVDSLTGVFNRRLFDERLEQEYARHSRSGALLSLIMLDIDFFKPFNDTYGHVQGDECLKRVSKAIKMGGFSPCGFCSSLRRRGIRLHPARNERYGSTRGCGKNTTGDH